MSMPSPSTSTLSSPSASRSSLSHWMTVRSSIAAFSIGTSSSSSPRAMTKPPTCCDRCRGKPSSVRASVEHPRRAPGCPDRARPRARAPASIVEPSHHCIERASAATCSASRPMRLGDVAQRAARPVADHGGGERRALATVLRIDVLDDLLAPLVLEVDVDVGRLVALARDEALEQQRHPRGIDLGDAEAEADGGIRRRAAPLAEDAERARRAHDVVHGQEIRFVSQLRDQRELVLDRAPHAARARRRASVGACPAAVSCAASSTASRPRERSRAGTRSAARRARSGSAPRSSQRSPRAARADRARAGAQAGADDARRSGTARSPRWSTVVPSRVAVSTSCSARRPRACMCTSPAATSGRPSSCPSACSAARRRRSCPS